MPLCAWMSARCLWASEMASRILFDRSWFSSGRSSAALAFCCLSSFSFSRLSSCWAVRIARLNGLLCRRGSFGDGRDAEKKLMVGVFRKGTKRRRERKKKFNGRDLTQTKGMKRKTERGENFTLALCWTNKRIWIARNPLHWTIAACGETVLIETQMNWGRGDHELARLMVSLSCFFFFTWI